MPPTRSSQNDRANITKMEAIMWVFVVIFLVIVFLSFGIPIEVRFSRGFIKGRFEWHMHRVMMNSRAWYHGYHDDILREIFYLPGNTVVWIINALTDKKYFEFDWFGKPIRPLPKNEMSEFVPR